MSGGWRWWLFVGVAHETPRMVYERPFVRLVRQLAAQVNAVTTAIGVALTPVLRDAVRAANDFAAQLAQVQLVTSSTPDEGVTPSS